MKQDKATRTTRGRFKKGQSGNSSGRPPGSRNKATLLYEQLFEDGAEELIKKAMQMAKNGDIRALSLCLDRILPTKRERSINLELHPLENPQDLPIHFQDITTAIAEGRITPAEGESLSKIAATHAELMAVVQFDRRIKHLQANLEVVRGYRSEMDRFMEEVDKHSPEPEEGLDQ